MCWKVDTPQVSTANTVTTTARELVPQVVTPDPEAPAFGGTEDTFANKKGKSRLKITPLDKTIDRSNEYKPVNF